MGKHEKKIWRKILPYYEEIGPLCSIADYDKRERGERFPVYYVQKKADVDEEVLMCEQCGQLVHDFYDFNFCPYCGETIREENKC